MRNLIPLLFLFTAAVNTATAAEAHTKGAVVVLNNVPVLKVITGLNSATPEKLASASAARLRQADEQAEVKAVRSGGVVEIKVGGDSILTATSAEASAHGVSLDRLGEQWATSIRDALALPTLKFSADTLRTPVGNIQVLQLVGSLAYGAEVTSSNDTVATVSKSESSVTVSSKAAGDSLIRARSGNAARTLTISVRPYAATLPQSFEVAVTGHPASSDLVRGAVEGCLKSKIVCVPGATCTFAKIDVKPLEPNQSEAITAYVRLHATDSFDAVGNVSITVRNGSGEFASETALWYSNSPESVTQVGSLFAAFLKPATPIRLLYHHFNATTQPLILRVEAVNDSDQVAKLLVTPGDSKPDKNPVRAGMTAGAQFLKLWQLGAGEVVEIPPRSNLMLSLRRLTPNETASGLARLEQLSGPDLLVRADALPAFELAGAWYDAAFSSTPWHEVGCRPLTEYDHAMYEPSSHIYPNPNKAEHFEYVVGRRPGTFMIGQQPIAGQDHTTNLDGNFGVMYTVEASASNPTSSPANVELSFEASAGYMGGLFLVDGDFVQTRLMGPKEQTTLAKFHLAPGASRRIKIVTFPVSGGSYPATLMLRAVESGTGPSLLH